MPEAEDLLTDAARHTTVFVRELWRRRGAGAGSVEPDLPQLLHRIDLLVTAIFGTAYGRSFTLRLAQPPPPAPLVRRLFRRHEWPTASTAIPATDGASIWLPASPADKYASVDTGGLRIMALRQAARAQRGSARALTCIADPLERPIYEILEADAADHDLIRLLPGLRELLIHTREAALAARPALALFPAARRPLEQWLRTIMGQQPATADCSPAPMTPQESVRCARQLAPRLLQAAQHTNPAIAGLLFRDVWIGELRLADSERGSQETSAGDLDGLPAKHRPRSARLPRRPRVRPRDERDEHRGSGAWMVQTSQPHEHAEDPFGAQRPTDRDESTAAEEFADSVSELAEARLVTTPGAPKEILLSDDPPEGGARRAPSQTHTQDVLTYPEWDWRAGAYRKPGAAVHLLESAPGSHDWVQRTLATHRAMLNGVRRQFESLRAQRTRLRQQMDGDDPDLEACIDALADARAGAVHTHGLYQCMRTARREMAVLMLIDISGSTDGWISSGRRVIDVEREALLLVCLALESLGERYSVLAFSGEGPSNVAIRLVKEFAEPYGEHVALRIAGLEPERFTRAGAAIRHASALLMREAARHRLLLMLSDGKPNDCDEYEGRYGIEDMRQAIIEARLQGVFPFCLTIDRHTASYLPAVFGEQQYAVLHRPELMPGALLGWLRKLVKS